MTLKEMRDEVVAGLGLQGIVDYDETSFVTRWLNRGVLDLLSRTRCVVRCVHLQTLAGVDTYTLAHAILSIVEIEDGARKRGRTERHYRDDDYWRRGDDFTLIRSDILKIPTPQEDGELDVWAVLRPVAMTLDDDSPSEEQHGAIPDEFQDAIILYALWRGSDYSDDSSGSQGERYRIQYEGQDGRAGRLREIRMMVNKRGTALAPRKRTRMLGNPDRRIWIG